MFLRKLLETEKQAFLCLANLVMKADGVVDEREMEIINSLREEMNTPNLLSNLTEAESYKVLASSKMPVKRAVYMELLAIAKADGVFDPSEEKYIKNVLTQLGLSEVFAKNVQKWLDAYFKLLEKGASLARGKKKEL
jgi:tellurite resistance protein